MSLNDTPRAMRLHIGLFGRRNSGKSSLVNALTGQHVATVSSVPGTTTDPVYKAMELHGIGPVVFIDTAGFDVEGIETVGVSRVGEPTEGEVCPTHVEPLRRAAEGLPPLVADADLHAVVEQGAEVLVLLPHAAETQREHILMGIDMRCVGSLNRRDERANEKKTKTD